MELQQLPSLKALHIFSIAAQCLNFTKAAEQLCITPSAVSHQIKRLEDSLHCKLFKREGKILRLTDEANKFSQVINQCFSQMREATKEISGQKSNIIQLGVSSAFAVKRLTPALSLWQEKHPQLDLRIRMISCEDNLNELDLNMILASKVDNPFYISDFICEESYYPVGNRSLVSKFAGKDLLEMISIQPLIDLEDINLWKLWAKYRGIDMPAPCKTRYFSHTLLMIQAALSGQGIAIVDKNIIKNELESGELVVLDDNAFVHPNTGYYLSSHKRNKNIGSIVELKEWISGLLIES